MVLLDVCGIQYAPPPQIYAKITQMEIKKKQLYTVEFFVKKAWTYFKKTLNIFFKNIQIEHFIIYVPV